MGVLLKEGSSAVVIGGAFAGLASAGWLSDSFDQVLVLERDEVADTDAKAYRLLEDLSTQGKSVEAAQEEANRRKGVPQFLHCHGWLAGGLASLDRLFPGFKEDTVRLGALLPSKGQAWTISGTAMVKLPPKARSSFQGLQGTRGYSFPKEEIVNQRSAWTTRFYSLPDELCHNGLNGDHSNNEVEAFDNFTRSLATPDIWEVVQESTPLNNPYTFKGAANALRSYDAWNGPENFCVVGDAFCVLNPRFGNGMTVAAKMAEQLGASVKEHLAATGSTQPSHRALQGLSTAYHKAAGKLTNFPFTLITSWDLMYGGTVGERNRGLVRTLWGWYISRIRELSDNDAEAWQALEGVIQMMKPPQALLASSLIAKVARHVLIKSFWEPALQWVPSSKMFWPLVMAR
ncbi:hypothetical protein WJX73_009006 [Symbiochloris irregularis]|uniref:Squalene monooxygenase n=1 Tax=Symbiochloris irregularis TaxID=706552 RepID=A0AAW1NM09_9CHLO